ncbi:MAG: fasciclin domain-containing protein, partial [Planctomycetota bacterium]
MKRFFALVCGAALSLAGSSANAFDKNIVETAVEAGNFKTLAAALAAADLVEAVKGPGPFTVFAPTDEAFAKLPKGTVE